MLRFRVLRTVSLYPLQVILMVLKEWAGPPVSSNTPYTCVGTYMNMASSQLYLALYGILRF